MKKMIVVAAICASFTAVSAQKRNKVSKKRNKVSKKINKNNVKSSSERTYDISVGYTRSMLEDYEGERFHGNGFSVSVGRFFNLGEGFSTTTSLGGSLVSLDKEDTGLVNGSAKTYEIGLSQRFSYNIEVNGVTFRPLLEAGYSQGRYTFNEEYSSDSFELHIDYSKYGGAVGVQVALANGLSPFIKYDISKVKLNSKGEQTTTINGQSSTEEFSSGSSDDRKLDFNALTVGLGYLF